MERKKIHLTHRESEVLGHIKEGLSSSEVADGLCLTKRAVDFHIMTAYQKIKALTGDEVMNRVKAFRALRDMEVVVIDRRLRKSTD